MNGLLTSGLVMTLTPPAMAARQSPEFSARHAWKIETIEEEQAVSIDIDGPLLMILESVFSFSGER